jgi:flagellar assembly factor FliW
MDSRKKIYFMNTNSTPFNTTKKILLRDLKKVFNYNFNQSDSKEEADIIIDNSNRYNFEEEEFKIYFENSNKLQMKLEANDDLGFIYGMLYISEKFLKVDPFWFWADKEPKKREKIEIDIKEYNSVRHFVRYRGWFVNDEVCLIGWTDTYPPPKEVWFPVFETLLRLGGNMVIPGTDLPRTGIHWDLASDMGFYITHHHAEPLGAEMFARAYPYLEANYNRYSNEFKKLWNIAITKQKDKKIIWTLGFRGQGDCPFWESDSNDYTELEKGEIISNVIKRQYDILCKYIKNPICCVYLYGEVMELYQMGYIKFPNGVIKIWSDNGYGKMVTRRTGNLNYRIKSLPDNDIEKNGVYYHVTFHDLQASNHLTMLQLEPDFIKNEVVNAYKKGVKEYLLINSGNIRPHIFYLGYLSELWTNGDYNPKKYFNNFINNYFSGSEKVKKCYEEFIKSGIKYGENIDDIGGDEFYHHPLRILIGYWIRGEFNSTDNNLYWLSKKIHWMNKLMISIIC